MPRRTLNIRSTIAPMSRPPSPHRARGLDLLRQGKTSAEVAAILGVKIGAVNNWARSLGVQGKRRGPRLGPQGPRGPHAAPRAEVLPVLDLLIQGELASTIAATLGISRQTVHRAKNRWLFSDG